MRRSTQPSMFAMIDYADFLDDAMDFLCVWGPMEGIRSYTAGSLDKGTLVGTTAKFNFENECLSTLCYLV